MAAVECNISQPALTRHIQSLEEELGATLFERTSRGMELTPFGEIVQHHANQVALSCDEMTRELEEVADGERGTLRLSAGPGWSYSIVPEAIRRMHLESPGIQVDCSSDLVAESMHKLLIGEVDIAINRQDTSVDPDGELVHETLLAIDHFIFSGKNHPILRQPTISVNDLQPYPWLSFRHSVEARQAVRDLFQGEGLKEPEPIVVTNSYQTCLSLLTSSDYLMVLPSTLRDIAYQQDIRVVPIRENLGTFPAGMSYRESATRLKYFNRFKAILQNVARDLS